MKRDEAMDVIFNAVKHGNRRVFSKRYLAVGIGGITALLLLMIAIFAPLLAPHDPVAVNIAQKFLPPSGTYWLGTDNLGRCIASRLIWGTRNTLLYSLLVSGICFVIGTVVGVIAGYFGGILDLLIMRVIDIGLALPGFMIVFAVAGTLGPGIWHIVIAVSLVWWTPYARLVRGMVMQVKTSDYVQSAVASGCGHMKILLKHILRNVLPAVVVMVSIEIGSVILTLAGFSFLGLGIQPPTPEWGVMLSDSKSFVQTHPQLLYYPGAAIMMAVMAFNLLGEGMQNGKKNQ
jgi:peptide/nickel transport system permease protein